MFLIYHQTSIRSITSIANDLFFQYEMDPNVPGGSEEFADIDTCTYVQ
jgi:hypothetical protein